MRFRAILVIGLAVSTMGCEGVVLIVSATPVPAKNAGADQSAAGANIVIATVPPTSTPPAASAGAARLTLSNASMVASDRQGFYALTFLLTETSGSSGAVVKSILVVPSAGNSDETGETCWRSQVRVEGGTTSDAFRAGSSRVPSFCWDRQLTIGSRVQAPATNGPAPGFVNSLDARRMPPRNAATANCNL